MRPFVVLISALSLLIFAPLVRAQTERQKSFMAAHESEGLWNYERDRSSDLADSHRSNTANIAKLQRKRERATISKYTHQIDALDRANVSATTETVTINNAKKAALYNRRGLAKLQLGDKRGAIDDLTLAAELFDEAGLNDISARSQQLIHTLEN